MIDRKVCGILFLLYIGSSLPKPLTVSRGSDARICETIECSDAADSILSSLDTEADPCNDFYQFACGGWIRNHPIPDNRPTHNQFYLASDRIQRRLREILDSDYSNDRDAIKKAKKFHKACMDENAIEALGAKRILDYIENLGGMPLFNVGLRDPNFSLERYIAATKHGIEMKESAIIQISVRVDDMNSSRHVIVLDQPHLIMPNSAYYLAQKFNSTRKAYLQFLRNYLGEIWMSVDQESGTRTFNDGALNRAVNEILYLETDLAKIMVPKAQRIDISKMYEKMTVEQLSLLISSEFNWLDFINGIMGKVGIEVDPTTEVVLFSKSYLSKMMNVLNRYNERKLRNYIVTRKVVALISLLPRRYRNTEAIYRRAVKGTTMESPRWEECSRKTNDLLPMAVGAIYARQEFSKENRATVLETIDNVVTSFKISLGNIEWMDRETKKKALNKVDQVNQLVGYPDYILDEEDPSLDEEYGEIQVSEEEYFQGEIEMRNIQFRKNLERLNRPVDKTSWNTPPARVNAYYEPNFNNVIFPAGILQQPFFHSAKPFAMNYGSIGTIAGHELTHGFDTSGSRYNAYGNMENWWTNSSRNSFERATQYLKRQYSSFYNELAGMYVDGNLTVTENTADNGGVRSAYDAYQLWRGINPGMEFQLPRLEQYTLEQLFFISNAQIWCSSDRSEYARQMALNSRHAPVRFRVEGTFQNFEKFGEAFGCRRGQDKLYPDPSETYRVW